MTKSLADLLPEPTKAPLVTELGEAISEARILTLDLETSPGLGDIWGLWQQNVGLTQLRQVTKVICFAAKWYGEEEILFYSDFHDGHDEMIAHAWRLMHEADAIVHFNGESFDMKHMQREFGISGLTAPSPHRDIDLLRVVKNRFRFMSNKLEHTSTQFGLEGKFQHSGHELWVRCMAGDAEAWEEMKTYNIQDVILTEEFFNKLRPWIKNLPGLGEVDIDDLVCSCGSFDLRRDGVHRTPMMIYPRYQCENCGRWQRGRKALGRASTTHGI